MNVRFTTFCSIQLKMNYRTPRRGKAPSSIGVRRPTERINEERAGLGSGQGACHSYVVNHFFHCKPLWFTVKKSGLQQASSGLSQLQQIAQFLPGHLHSIHSAIRMINRHLDKGFEPSRIEFDDFLVNVLKLTSARL